MLIHKAKFLYQLVDYLHRNGASRSTLKNYRSDVSTFLTYLSSKQALSSFEEVPFSAQDKYSFANYLKTNGKKESTIRRAMASITALEAAIGKHVRNTSSENEKIVPIFEDLGFVSYLKHQGASKKTIQNYCSDLNDIDRWNKQNGGLSLSHQVISSIDRNEYSKHLERTGKSKATIARRLSSLNVYIHYLEAISPTKKNQNDQTPKQPPILSTELLVKDFTHWLHSNK